MTEEIYLDNASTTMVIPSVVEVMRDCMLNDYGNPSSQHSLGEIAAKRLRVAREGMGNALFVNTSEIVFTSGGTEANNLAIFGGAYARKKKGMHCITSVIEHPSVFNAFKRLAKEGWDISYLPVSSDGFIDLERLSRLLRKDTTLVSIMHVNNEIGSIQPVKEIGKILNGLQNPPLFHVDAVQSFCRYPVNPKEWQAHMVSLSAHKIHASKGVGALFLKKGVRLNSLFSGGEQEAGIRAGTENVPGIVGMVEAVRCLKPKSDWNELNCLRLKRMLFDGLTEAIPKIFLIGPKLEEGAYHILSMSLPGVPAEAMQRGLSAWYGVHVGIGAACSSKKKNASHVLDAIGLDPKLARCAIRVSLSQFNTEEQITRSIIAIRECYKRLLR